MEGGWFDEEAIEQERFDADLEQAEMEAEGRRIAALHRRGICTHGWVQQSMAGNDLLKTRGIPYGQIVCLEDGCSAVFTNEQAWDQARWEVTA